MKKINMFLAVIMILSFVININAQDAKQREWLLKFAEEQEKISKREKAEAESIAVAKNFPIRVEYKDGTIIELMRFENGLGMYNITESNLNAAKTISTDKVWPGGVGGYSLSGDTVGIWDGGKVRNTHQELTGRVTQVDGATTLSDHATHVGGTMIASGVESFAKGMGFGTGARLRAYDWSNAESEMATAAAGRLRVSNHSYGTLTGWRWGALGDNRWAWYGNLAVSAVEDYGFGYYDTRSQQWDNISYNAPNYLIVKSAGNDRLEGPTSTVEHWVRVGGEWQLQTATRNRDGDPDGYECINYQGVAKNILTVGAVNIITGGWSGAGSVVMSSFSNWGPTDDGRIKPDIVGAGVGIRSSIATADNAYDTYDGTSMSAPNISGSIGLLIQHQRNLHGNTPLLSSTLKGLVINTADEAGSHEGPDYKFGWGLMNTLKAVNLMTANKNSLNNFYIKELTLNNNDSITILVPSNGTSPLRATICWTDPAGTPPPVSLDPPNLMLVNDLDLRAIRDGEVIFPYILDPVNPSAAATRGDNFRDNVEQIHIPSPSAGLYTFRIKHKGTLQGGAQVVSFITSGGQELVVEYPNGGEVWPLGSTQKIKWATSNFGGNVKIELSRNGGTSYEVLFESIPNDGEENWFVSGSTTSSARIRVTSVTYPNISDFSNSNFLIRQPSLNITSPIGGEVWIGDSPYFITWNSTNLPGTIKIELTRDGGSTFETLYSETPNDGSERWGVTGPATTRARIKITSNMVPTLSSISPNNFEIKFPYIAVLKPGDKEGFLTDEVVDITWDSFLASDYVNIDLSRDDGISYEPLLINTPNDGTESWTTTPPLTSKARIRITDAANPALVGVSPSPFTIGVEGVSRVSQGWNLISIPFEIAEDRKDSLYPSASSPAFKYSTEGNYEISPYLLNKNGYWLQFPSASEINFIGLPRLFDSVNLKKGWNLIGALSVPIRVSDLTTDPVGIIDGDIWGFEGKYQKVTILNPGKGYWIKASQDGMLIMVPSIR